MTKSKSMMLSYALFLLCLNRVQAQSGAATSGGNATGAGGTVSYTVGIVNYTTEANGSTVITQGIQQPYEIQVVNGIQETSIDLSSIYPNPTTDYVMLSLKGELQNMNYALTDMQGRLIREQNIVKEQTSIPMTSLTEGAYLVKVYNDKKEIKSYKIIKNN